MLRSLVSNFERITYCLGTWKNSSLVWLGWSAEKVKCVYKRKSGGYSSQWCRWQSVRAGRGSENGPKCLASFHAVLTSMTALTASSLSLALSHLLSLDSSLLFLTPVFWLFLSLRKDAWVVEYNYGWMNWNIQTSLRLLKTPPMSRLCCFPTAHTLVSGLK